MARFEDVIKEQVDNVLDARKLDLARHHDYLEEMVKPCPITRHSDCFGHTVRHGTGHLWSNPLKAILKP